jgi:electron transfer flavoprotein beta subunit
MQAKKKPLETILLAELDVNSTNQLQLVKVEEPPARAPGVKVANVQELIEKLRNDARISQ